MVLEGSCCHNKLVSVLDKVVAGTTRQLQQGSYNKVVKVGYLTLVTICLKP